MKFRNNVTGFLVLFAAWNATAADRAGNFNIGDGAGGYNARMSGHSVAPLHMRTC
jgi:hypothetical protein